MQAVMASDFAIGQFRFLETLLLVHGRWSYLRVVRMVKFFLYKNILFGLTVFFANAISFFSGQIIYNGKSGNLLGKQVVLFMIGYHGELHMHYPHRWQCCSCPPRQLNCCF